MPGNRKEFESRMFSVQFKAQSLEETFENAGRYGIEFFNAAYSGVKANVSNAIENLLAGPAAVDKDSILEWISQCTQAIACLKDKKLIEKSGNKELIKAEKDTRKIRENIAAWDKLYSEHVNDLLNEDGSMRDLSSAAAGTPLAEIKEKHDIIMDNFRTIGLNRANAKDRDDFKKFETKLKAAAKSTFRDSGEFKTILSELSAFKKGVDFSEAQEPLSIQWRQLNEKQRLALPMFLLKDRINKYIAHKAKDGVNVKDFKKLAAIEELNQFVSKRILDIGPEEFTFGDKPYNTEKIQPAYSQELQSLNEKRAAFQVAPYEDTHIDTIHYSIQLEPGERDKAALSEIENYSSCMDRIMLRKQDDIFRKNVKCTKEDLGKGINEFKNIRGAAAKEALAAQKEAAKKQNTMKL